MNFRILPVTEIDPPHLEPLVLQSELEGYRYVRHLSDAWQSGAERFDKPGEILFGAFAEDQWVGTGGLTLDPFNPGPRNGRVRRMYVHPNWRGHGIGRALLSNVVNAAHGHFDNLTLFTDNPVAAQMYESAGFERVDLEKVTHLKVLEMS